MNPGFAAVIGLAVTLATCGLDGGGGAAAGLGFAAGTTEAPMINAGVACLSSQAANSFLTHSGDLGKVFEDRSSEKGFKTLATSVISSGLVKGLGSYFNLPPQPKGWLDHLKVQGLQSAVNVGVDVTLGGQSFEESLKNNLKAFPVNVAAGVAANKIGAAYKEAEINPLTHKLIHGVVGAAQGAVFSDDPEKGAVK